MSENRNVPKVPRSRQQACNGHYCRSYSDPKHDAVPILRAAAPWLQRGGSRALDAGGTDDLGLPPTLPFQISKRLTLINHGQRGLIRKLGENCRPHLQYYVAFVGVMFQRKSKGAPVISDISYRKPDALKRSAVS